MQPTNLRKVSVNLEFFKSIHIYTRICQTQKKHFDTLFIQLVLCTGISKSLRSLKFLTQSCIALSAYQETAKTTEIVKSIKQNTTSATRPLFSLQCILFLKVKGNVDPSVAVLSNFLKASVLSVHGKPNKILKYLKPKNLKNPRYKQKASTVNFG